MHEMTDFDAVAAKLSLARSQELLSQLVTQDTHRLEYRVELAKVLDLLGGLFSSDFETSVAYRKQAVDVLERSDDEFRGVLKRESWLNLTRTNLGKNLLTAGEMERATNLIAAGERSERELAQRSPRDHEAQSSWAFFKAQLGRCHIEAGRFVDAENQLRQALQIYDQHLIELRPEYFLEYKVAYAECESLLARLLNSLRQHSEAVSVSGDAINRLTRVLDDTPRHRWARELLAEVLQEHALALTARANLYEAEAALRESLKVLQDVAEIRDRNTLQISLGNVRLGQLLCSMDRKEEGRACFRDAQLLLQSASANASEPSTDSTLPEVLLEINCPLSDVRNTLHGLEGAKSIWHSQDARRWQLLGLAQYRAGDWPGARHSLEEAIELRPYADPFDLFLLAMACQRLGDHPAACQSYDKAIANYDRPVSYFAFAFPFELHNLRREVEALLLLSDHS
jgi:tetratricopeptide (TPR) repeat protein